MTQKMCFLFLNGIPRLEDSAIFNFVIAVSQYQVKLSNNPMRVNGIKSKEMHEEYTYTVEVVIRTFRVRFSLQDVSKLCRFCVEENETFGHILNKSVII